MGGATANATRHGWPIRGLSPRGRGNRPQWSCGYLAYRSIPAWAGQPRRASRSRWRRSVYPRVGGATLAVPRHDCQLMGLSPRGRGNRCQQRSRLSALRSIPAWAGQPVEYPYGRDTAEVYPRVGGATRSGTCRRWWPLGLSPRGRGNRAKIRIQTPSHRSIPAWAGQPPWHTLLVIGIRVYPRVGGATATEAQKGTQAGGLSPRGRGNRSPEAVYPNGSGSIPAWAGQPWASPPRRTTCWVYPRVGGATYLQWIGKRDGRGLSPRGRGNPEHVVNGNVHHRSIPAWAGQPLASGAGVRPREVYPRVGGATRARGPGMGQRRGLSPRGRGNLVEIACMDGKGRSIPAWAGQPFPTGRPPYGLRVYPRVGGATSP